MLAAPPPVQPERGFLSYRHSAVEFLRIGSGPELLIGFHGFGDRADLFSVLSPALSPHFTFYALSLPYHGGTEWNEGLFSRADVEAWVELLCQRHDTRRFSLMGYSMGGKIAMSLLPRFADRLHQLWLLAPDGIRTHHLYDVAALPGWFLAIVNAMLARPKLFFSTVRLAYRAGLLTKFLHDFTFNHFETERQRVRFRNVSRSVPDFTVKPHRVQNILNQHRVPVALFYGVRDEVIPAAGGREFANELKKVRLFELDKGHLLVDEDLSCLLQKLLANSWLIGQ